MSLAPRACEDELADLKIDLYQLQQATCQAVLRCGHALLEAEETHRTLQNVVTILLGYVEHGHDLPTCTDDHCTCGFLMAFNMAKSLSAGEPTDPPVVVLYPPPVS